VANSVEMGREPDEWPTFALPERVDLTADCGLEAFLRAHQGSPVRLQAAGLRRLDGLLVQYLLAVAQDWAARGLGFVVTDVRVEQAAILRLVGVGPDHLPWKAAA